MSDMKPDPRQALAPTWLIVTHLLGAAVMLYFVPHTGSQIPSEPTIKNPIVNDPVLETPIINVAELQAPIVSDHTSSQLSNNRQNQEVAQ